MKNVYRFPLAVLVLCSYSYALAADNFSYTGTVDIPPPITGSGSFRTVNELTTGLSTSGLEMTFPGYNGSQRAATQVNFTGLPMLAAFPNVGFTGVGARLDFSVPSIGINEVFQGATRDDSVDLLHEYLKKNAGQIFNKLAQVSPSSPIAGNPNSLMSRMATGAFNSAFAPFSTNRTDPEDAAGAPSLLGVGLGFGSYSGSGVDTRAVTVPLSYTYRSPLQPSRQLAVDLPITVSDVQGARVYTGSLGVSYRFPVTDYWTLSPNLAYGATYSDDLGSAGNILSGALTSALNFQFEAVGLTIGNMVGYYAALNAPFRGYDSNPDLRNWVFRNGVMISDQFSLAGTKTIGVYLIDTRYTGSSLYDKYTDEVGITIGTNKSAASQRSYFSGSVGYLLGQQSRGWSINIGYWF